MGLPLRSEVLHVQGAAVQRGAKRGREAERERQRREGRSATCAPDATSTAARPRLVKAQRGPRATLAAADAKRPEAREPVSSVSPIASEAPSRTSTTASRQPATLTGKREWGGRRGDRHIQQEERAKKKHFMRKQAWGRNWMESGNFFFMWRETTVPRSL